jgi:hypothetical protein
MLFLSGSFFDSIRLNPSLNIKLERRNQTKTLASVGMLFGGIHSALIKKKFHRKFIEIIIYTCTTPPN